MELLETVGEFAKHILSIVALAGLALGGVKYIPKWYRWFGSWTFVTREELNRLREVEPKYNKCETELKTLTAFCTPYKEQLERELEKRYGKREA